MVKHLVWADFQPVYRNLKTLQALTSAKKGTSDHRRWTSRNGTGDLAAGNRKKTTAAAAAADLINSIYRNLIIEFIVTGLQSWVHIVSSDGPFRRFIIHLARRFKLLSLNTVKLSFRRDRSEIYIHEYAKNTSTIQWSLAQEIVNSTDDKLNSRSISKWRWSQTGCRASRHPLN